MNNWELERQKATLEVLRLFLTRILTLSTALVAAGIGLAKLSPPDGGQGNLYFVTLVAFGLSVLFALLALGTIVASLAAGAMNVGASWAVQLLSVLVVASFAVGVGLSVLLARGLCALGGAVGAGVPMGGPG